MPDMKTKTWFFKFTYFKESISITANQNENNVPMKSEAEHKNSWCITSSWKNNIRKNAPRRPKGARGLPPEAACLSR
jgi:hypothetical protein